MPSWQVRRLLTRDDAISGRLVRDTVRVRVAGVGTVTGERGSNDQIHDDL